MIKIHDADELTGKIKLVYNPLSELSLALDLLCHPEHHKTHSAWSNTVLTGLSKKERAQLLHFESIIDGYLNLDLHIEYLNWNFDSDDQLAGVSDFLCNKNNWISPLKSEEIERLTTFTSFLWDSYIHPVVLEHMPHIKTQLDTGSELLLSGGYRRLFNSVSERIGYGQGGMLKIEKWLQAEFSASELSVFYVELVIFAFPHLVVSDRHDRGSFFISWDVPFQADAPVIPGIDRISSAAFALSDKSRLRILFMLSSAPMTQKELSSLMGFAKSTISRHINILIEVGFIEPDSSGRNVLLNLNRKRMKEISRDIVDWIA